MATWKKRLLKDLADLEEGQFQVTDENGEPMTDMSEFYVDMKGPPDTPYHGYSWTIRFTIPQTFPFSSPSVGFVQKIMHPNIDFASGSICLDALNSKWSACVTIRHIVEVILPWLLSNPNPNDPLNREAAALFMNNSTEYTRQVLLINQKYAIKNI